MSDNVIYNDYDECIGYYDDIVEMYKSMIKTEIDLENVEEVKNLTEELEEINNHKGYSGLLVLSENNGMGFTARKYKELERE